MQTEFIIATPADAPTVARLVIELTDEICQRAEIKGFNINVEETIARTIDFIKRGFYTAILGVQEGRVIAVACIAESYALYAGGKIGIVQEFFVSPEYRSSGVGAQLIEAVNAHGREQGWACVELCTPPLPAFDNTLAFYQRNGMAAVGGRKMRAYLES
ncbi:GNAT family N-acetyltransferase [Oxalobacteraceae bacterium]|nr:GNAT family N-acetyltransferase [Oxalobacteraceae bacterium]